MDQELGPLNQPNIIKEEVFIPILIEASILPEKESLLIDFIERFDDQQKPFSFRGDNYKLNLFRRYVGSREFTLNYNNKSAFVSLKRAAVGVVFIINLAEAKS